MTEQEIIERANHEEELRQKANKKQEIKEFLAPYFVEQHRKQNNEARILLNQREKSLLERRIIGVV